MDMRRAAARLARPAPLRLGDAPSLAGVRPLTGARRAGDLPRELLARLRRAIGRRRRLVAGALAGLAVVIATQSLAPARPPTTTVLAAARDLPAGATLAAADLTPVALPPKAVPAGAISSLGDAVGRTTTGALRRGEPLTDVRIDAGPLARPGDGMVAAPVRLADAQAAALLRPGERIDVLAASTSPEAGGRAAAVVASGVTVLDAPAAAGNSGGALGSSELGGALVVLATTADQARALAQAQVSARLSAVVVG